MRKTILKISIVLLVIIFLPIGFFLVNELSTLSQDEQMVERVFNKQLESILFSVNQYSENVISYWASNLDLPIACNSDAMEGVANNILENNPSIEQIGFIQIAGNENLAIYGQSPGIPRDLITSDSVKLNRLIGFLENDYQKIEILSLDKKTVLYFVMKNQAANVLCFIIINSENFIQQSLGPEIQQVSQELFYISVSDSISGNIIIATEGTSLDPLEVRETPLWYFPGYIIGIRLLSGTLNELVSERGQKGRNILWGLVIVVLIGAVFVIWNIRKEIRLAELKSDFVSNVSHEIRTPLALIAMYAETLKLKRINKPEKQEEYLETIYSESVKLSNIVNRILNFSKIENRKKIFDLEPLLVNDLIHAVLNSYKPHFEANKVAVIYSPIENNIYIKANQEGVSEALINLFDNAVKYGKESGKKVNLRCRVQKKNVIIEVEDNGPGISAKDRNHIFDKFYRVTKGNLANNVKGSGLGLNIVKQIMKTHGGSVSVKSKIGEGSCFRLKFLTAKNKNNG